MRAFFSWLLVFSLQASVTALALALVAAAVVSLAQAARLEGEP